jgi:oligopeptidase A
VHGRALSTAQRRIVECYQRDARLAGVALNDRDRARFTALQTELAALSRAFGNRVLDATKAFALVLTDAKDADGLPASLLAMAAQVARERGVDKEATAQAGPWAITLDAPLFTPFMTYSTRSDLRERVYRAFMTRASSGSADNTATIHALLRARREMAALLSFPSYAQYSLASKLVPSVEVVEKFLGDLQTVGFPAAQREHKDLTAFARSQGYTGGELRHWDVAYWAERQRASLFDFTDEQLRPYFPFPRVLHGLFQLANELFGIVSTRSHDRCSGRRGRLLILCSSVFSFPCSADDPREEGR